MSEGISTSEPAINNLCAREIADVAYEVATNVLHEHEITKATALTPIDTVGFVEAVESAISPELLGERNLWLRKRAILRDSLWYAAQISLNPVLLQITWDQESQRIRRRTQPKMGSISLRYPV